MPMRPSEPQQVWTDALLDSPHEVRDKAQRVRTMFNAIAPRYELVNTLFSGGRDAYWRRKAVELASVRREDVVLDVACGTGDFARAFVRSGAGQVVGADFAHEMLLCAGRRPRSAGGGRTDAAGFTGPHWIEADALRLPFADESFSIVSCAFGLRNLGDLDQGLREARRVLRPGGRCVILEFTRPDNAMFRRVYEFYSNRLMPKAATMISGDRYGAYRYLPRSVVSFLTAEEMCRRLREAGLSQPRATPLTLGVVTVYVAGRDA